VRSFLPIPQLHNSESQSKSQSDGSLKRASWQHPSGWNCVGGMCSGRARPAAPQASGWRWVFRGASRRSLVMLCTHTFLCSLYVAPPPQLHNPGSTLNRFRPPHTTGDRSVNPVDDAQQTVAVVSTSGSSSGKKAALRRGGMKAGAIQAGEPAQPLQQLYQDLCQVRLRCAR